MASVQRGRRSHLDIAMQHLRREAVQVGDCARRLAEDAALAKAGLPSMTVHDLPERNIEILNDVHGASRTERYVAMW